MKARSGADRKPPLAAEPAAGADLRVRRKVGFPIVGIGASAGGLAAFEAFFCWSQPRRVACACRSTFFRSLAQDQNERAICIVLSGTGSDGTLGVRAVKGEGGMVMVQNPESTEHDGMPHRHRH